MMPPHITPKHAQQATLSVIFNVLFCHRKKCWFINNWWSFWTHYLEWYPWEAWSRLSALHSYINTQYTKLRILHFTWQKILMAILEGSAFNSVFYTIIVIINMTEKSFLLLKINNKMCRMISNESYFSNQLRVLSKTVLNTDLKSTNSITT